MTLHISFKYMFPNFFPNCSMERKINHFKKDQLFWPILEREIGPVIFVREVWNRSKEFKTKKVTVDNEMDRPCDYATGKMPLKQQLHSLH